MSTGNNIGKFAVENKGRIAAAIVGITAILVVLAALPSIWPRAFAPLNTLTIDTDPENMLPEDEAVRVFHDRMKKIMSLNDMIVIGVVGESGDEAGVFTPDSLERIFALTRFSRGLRWRDPQNPFHRDGVVEVDMIAPSMVDNVESGGAGTVRFEWLMPRPPDTGEEALEVRRKALEIPFLKDTLVSADGKALALYLPITTKDVSYRIYDALRKKLDNASLLFPSEIGNLDNVLRSLASASGGKGEKLVRDLWEGLSPDTRQLILDAEADIDAWRKVLSRSEKAENAGDKAARLFDARRKAVKALVSDLNEWIEGPLDGKWLRPDPEMRDRLSPSGRELLEAPAADLSDVQKRRIKRLWVERAFQGDIIPAGVADCKEGLDYHITGLPVAEDTFGVQMFKQMAISAPVAMLIIFLLMWFFFRSAVVILPAMYDALIATAATMSLLVITGNTVHIMSSMIPIFIVPIAVLDDVHVISEFFDRYQKSGDRKKTIVALMGDLFTPMLYTTLTTAVGFASLALAPIPPVQVFGLFVAFGVIVAWLCSILLVPAFIATLPQKTLDNFGAKHVAGETGQTTVLGRLLNATGRGTYRYAKPILALSIVALVISAYGISRIRINDNPTKWFEKAHPIRVADRVLNEHFGGTYMAYLAFRPEKAPAIPLETQIHKQASPNKSGAGVEGRESPQAQSGAPDTGGEPSLPSGLGGTGEDGNGSSGQEEERNTSGPSLPAGLGGKPEDSPPPQDSKSMPADTPEEKPQIFKDPATLRWIGALQDYMDGELGTLVGKSNSVTDIVETVHRELMVGVKRDGKKITEAEAMRVPDTRGAVAQSLLQFQNSHRPQDLWHFVTPDYRTAVVWLQLTSGDNRDMRKVAGRVNHWLSFWVADKEKAAAMAKEHPEGFRPVLRSVTRFAEASGVDTGGVEERIADSPGEAAAELKEKVEKLSPAAGLQHDWFGLTYINVVWQEKMVAGMLKALLGSFLAVFLMMTLLYRSALWGALCMAPLTVTIAMIYGLVGLVGKDYDMPVAVLSALSLGLAVDYAIHFLTRSRMMYVDHGSWKKTAGPVFGEPARAISRNAIVVGIGFLPLLLAPLVPYQTVGIFIAAILLLAGLATLLILPAAMTLLENLLFPRTRRICTLCHRGTCIVSAVAAVALIMVNLREFLQAGWNMLTLVSLPIIIVLAGGCAWMSRGERRTSERFAADESNGE